MTHVDPISRFVRAGAVLHVDDAGGTGVPVIFQHGLCGDANQTREAFPEDSAYRQITLECRGHGQSEAGELQDLSIATFAEDVAALIANLNAGPVFVGGISMGAAIALRLAVKRPDLVRGIFLVRPAWITKSAPSNMSPNALVGDLLHRHPPAEAHRIFMQSDLVKSLADIAPDNLKTLETFFQREPFAVTAALLKQISEDGPGVDESEVCALSIPALILGTDGDFIHPLSYARALADLIPAATFKTVTSKAVSKDRYLAETQLAVTTFLKEHMQ